MLKNLFKFAVLFFSIVLGSFLIHIAAAEQWSSENAIEIIRLSYFFNGIFTFCFLTLLIILSKRYKDHIGFIFLAGSFLKTAMFLGLIKFSALDIDKNLFLDFFVPYAICLSVEIYLVVTLLKRFKYL